MRGLLLIAVGVAVLGALMLITRWQEPTPLPVTTPTPAAGEPWWHYLAQGGSLFAGTALLGPAGGNLAVQGLRAGGL